jgi:hypothetical protein
MVGVFGRGGYFWSMTASVDVVRGYYTDAPTLTGVYVDFMCGTYTPDQFLFTRKDFFLTTIDC